MGGVDAAVWPAAVAKRALQLAGEQAYALGHDEVSAEHLLLGVLEDVRQPLDLVRGSRRHRRIAAHVGLPEGYQGRPGSSLRPSRSTLTICGRPSRPRLSGSSDEPTRTTRVRRGLPAGVRVGRRPDHLGLPGMESSNKAPPTVTLVPGATRPAGLAVTDLHDLGQLQARFNADQEMPRLVLALAPT